MATSGRIEGGRTFGQAYFYINWWLNSQNVANNTSNIGWNCGYHFQSNDCQLDDGVVNLNGERWRNSGRVKNYDGNFTTRDHGIASGSFDIGHNADGTAWLSVSGGIKPYQNNRSEGSGGWDLPTIPRASQPSVNTYPSNSPNVNIGDACTIHMNRASSSFTHTVSVSFGGWSKTLGTGVGDNVRWDTAADKASICAQIPNANSGNGTITVTTYSGGTNVGSKTCSIALFLVNSTPTFTNFDYKDANETVVAITGSNQAIVQGKSALQAVILASQKMTANDSATAQKYALNIGQTNVSQNYSTDDLFIPLGTPTSSGTQRLTITAFDSRNNSKAVYKDITIIPYSSPVITATIARLNSFEDQTTLKISGSFAPVIVEGEMQNSINPTTDVKYRIKDSESGEWGEWITVVAILNDNQFTTPDVLILLDNTKQFNVQVSLKDKFEEVIANLVLNVGEPVFYVGKNGVVGVNNKPTGNKKGLHLKNNDNLFLQIYPVGSIFFTTANVNPTTYFGGEWEAFGTGRVLVGVGSNGTTNYAEAGMTGGADNVTLTAAQMPSHNHNMIGYYDDANYNTGTIPSGGKQYSLPYDAGSTTRTFQTENAGSGSSHENRMPFISCFMWRRTT